MHLNANTARFVLIKNKIRTFLGSEQVGGIASLHGSEERFTAADRALFRSADFSRPWEEGCFDRLVSRAPPHLRFYWPSWPNRTACEAVEEDERNMVMGVDGNGDCVYWRAPAEGGGSDSDRPPPRGDTTTQQQQQRQQQQQPAAAAADELSPPSVVRAAASSESGSTEEERPSSSSSSSEERWELLNDGTCERSTSAERATAHSEAACLGSVAAWTCVEHIPDAAIAGAAYCLPQPVQHNGSSSSGDAWPGSANRLAPTVVTGAGAGGGGGGGGGGRGGAASSTATVMRRTYPTLASCEAQCVVEDPGRTVTCWVDIFWSVCFSLSFP